MLIYAWSLGGTYDCFKANCALYSGDSRSLHLYPSSCSTLISYTDANWDGCLDTHAPLLVTVCFLGITYYPGPLNYNLPYLALVLKLYTWVLLMSFWNPIGYRIFFLSFTVLFSKQHWSIVITLVSSIYLGILLIISALNIPRWTFISFVRRLPVGKFVSYMFLLAIRLRISSIKAFFWFYLKIFLTILVFGSLPFWLRRSC